MQHRTSLPKKKLIEPVIFANPKETDILEKRKNSDWQFEIFTLKCKRNKNEKVQQC